MKRGMIFLLLASVASVVCIAYGGITNKTDNLDPFAYPITGMSITGLDKCFAEVKGQVPVGPKIIGIQVRDETHVLIQTGKLSGPLAGAGKWMFFEKIEGKWKKIKEIDWVS